MKYYKRMLTYQNNSFFLFGMRGSGKSTWTKKTYPDAMFIDLLNEEYYQNFLRSPELFAFKLNACAPQSWVVIDEVQRLPNLLNEVHRAIENKQLKFVLTGSSSRKLRRSGVNLLGGRAGKKIMFPLTPWELDEDYSLTKILRYGSLPIIWSAVDASEKLKAYTQIFLKEEIQSEALVRNLAGFARFLPVAALFNAQILNKSSLARDVGIGRTTIEDYFSILEDCYLGFYLRGFEGKLRVKERLSPKWIWHDTGVVRSLKNMKGEVSEEEKGSLFESWILSLIRCQNDYFGHLFDEIYYWSPLEAKHIEVDCLLLRGDEFCAIEIKSSTRFRSEMLSGLKAIHSLPKIKRRILVYCGNEDLKSNEGIEILSLSTFLKLVEKGW